MQLHHLSNSIQVTLLPKRIPRLLAIDDPLVQLCLINGANCRDIDHKPQKGVIGSVGEEGPELSGFLKVPVVEHPQTFLVLVVFGTKVD